MRGSILVGALVLGFSLLQGQISPPLELPEVVVIGKEERAIPGGAKQPPQPPAPLKGALLDSLNPLSKHGLVGFFPLPAFPSQLSLPQPVDRFVEGSLGQYTSASLSGFARWGGKTTLLALAGYLNATQGHVREADSLGFGITMQARVLALPETWFGQRGSGTVTGGVRWRQYQLFGDSGAPRRLSFAVGLRGAFEARLNALRYEVDADFSAFSLRQGQIMRSEQHMRVRLGALYPDSALPAGGIASQLDIRLWEEQTQVVWEFLVPGIWARSPWLFRGAAGMQLARLSRGQIHFLPALEGELQYGLSSRWRLVLAGWSRLQEKGWRELWEANPYVDLRTSPTSPHDRLAARVALQWMPAAWGSLEGALQVRSVARWWSWERTEMGFALHTLPVTVWEARVDAFARISEHMTVGGALQGGRATTSGGGDVAYYTPLKLELTSAQRWMEKLGSRLGIEIVSSRSAGARERLPGYVRMWGELYYELMPRMILKAFLDNLLNADIRHWSGYPERGIFFAAAVRWNW